jgi:hypothetical protein
MSGERDDCECVNCAIFTLQEKVREQSEMIQELQNSNFQLHQWIQSQEMRHREEMATITRVVSQNTVRLSSHRRQLRLLRRRQSPMNIPAESVGSRVSTTSSPFPEERSPPTDRQNVEEPSIIGPSRKCGISTVRRFYGSKGSKTQGRYNSYQ